MKDLTTAQRKVLSFIIHRQKKQGAPPTVREIAEHFGYKSTNNVRQHLGLIERKGYLRLIPGKSRGIEVSIGFEVEAGGNSFAVPLVGAVAAGKPITAVENIEDYISLDKNLFKGPGLFTLRVKGDSMKGIGILDGDLAIVRQQQSAEPGEIVVAIINGEATLKRFFRQDNQIVLRAENPQYQDLLISLEQGDQVQIAGKLIGVMRRM